MENWKMERRYSGNMHRDKVGEKMNKQYEFRNQTNVINAADNDKKVISGKAICFNDKTCLCEMDGIQYFEVILPEALNNCKMDDICLKYNHDDNSQIIARVRNKSLSIDKQPDGLYFSANMPDTTFANDIYTLIEDRTLTDVSFGFVVAENGDFYDPQTHTRYIKNIQYIKEISIVDVGAYQNAYVNCRDYFTAQSEMEKRAAEEEQRKRLYLLTF